MPVPLSGGLSTCTLKPLLPCISFIISSLEKTSQYSFCYMHSEYHVLLSSKHLPGFQFCIPLCGCLINVFFLLPNSKLCEARTHHCFSTILSLMPCTISTYSSSCSASIWIVDFLFFYLFSLFCQLLFIFSFFGPLSSFFWLCILSLFLIFPSIIWLSFWMLFYGWVQDSLCKWTVSNDKKAVVEKGWWHSIACYYLNSKTLLHVKTWLLQQSPLICSLSFCRWLLAVNWCLKISKEKFQK